MSSTDEHTRSEMERALRQAAEPMSPAARADVRRTVMAAVDSSARRTGRRLTIRRTAVALAACVAVTGGVAYAASNALPGESLYPVKRGTEEALLGILPDGALERSLLLRIAERRTAEAAALAAQSGASDRYHHAIDDLRDAVHRATPEGEVLPEAEMERLQHEAQKAPESAREEIEHAITDPSGTQTEQDPHSGTGSGGTGSGSTGGGSGGDTSGGTGGDTHGGGTGTGDGGHDSGGGDSADHTGDMGPQP